VLTATLLTATVVTVPVAQGRPFAPTAHAEEPELDTSTTVTVVDSDAARQLAERFAPIVAIQTQKEPCGKGEPYYPADVGVILDQPDVVLLSASGDLIGRSPGAVDLLNAPEGSNFDLPGATLRPGCDFERRFGWRTGGPPVQYARVVRDRDDPTVLIVQYWEYFVYNQWNNVHESDWESALVVFDATTPEEALAKGPTMMSLSQHYGNERRPWESIERHGDRPVIYPAAGSHAFFYSQKLWFGMSGDAGFGCDSTVAPSTELDPRVDMLPAAGTAANGYGWMGFRGRWGERAPTINDSEVGPQYTRQWRTPVQYVRSGRDGAVSVPQIDFAGVTTFFCNATKEVSAVINHLMDNPALLLGLVIGIVAVIVLLVRRTVWRPASADPLRQRRRGGQIAAAAVAVVRRDWRRLLPVSAIALAGGVLAAILQPLIIDHTFLGNFLGDGQLHGPVGLLIALSAGIIETLVFILIALVVGVHIAHRLDEPRHPSEARGALRSGGLAPMAALFAAFAFTGVFGLVLVPMFAAAPAAAVAEGLRPRAALRRSRQLGKGQRWRVFCITFLVLTSTVLLAPLLGVLALLITGKVFWVANVIAGLVYAVTIPWLAVASYLLWADLAARSSAEAGQMAAADV
jgi:hypothetical protein